MTRQRLLEAGVQVFKDRGYSDATIDEIVTQAAVGRATFYLHFKSKFDVLRAAILETERRNEDMIADLKEAAAGDASALRGWLPRRLAWMPILFSSAPTLRCARISAGTSRKSFIFGSVSESGEAGSQAG